MKKSNKKNLKGMELLNPIDTNAINGGYQPGDQIKCSWGHKLYFCANYEVGCPKTFTVGKCTLDIGCSSSFYVKPIQDKIQNN